MEGEGNDLQQGLARRINHVEFAIGFGRDKCARTVRQKSHVARARMNLDVSDDLERLRVNCENITAGFAGDVEKLSVGADAGAFRFPSDWNKGQDFIRYRIQNRGRTYVL